MRRSHGFTLIEIMVVLVIMAVFLSVVILGFDRLDSRRAEKQVIELTVWLKYVADMAIFDGVVYGIDLKGNDLDVYGYTGNEWRRSMVFDSYSVADPAKISFSVPQESSLFDAVGDDDERPLPEIALLPSGDTEPSGGRFVIEIEGQRSLALFWGDNGSLVTEAVED